MKKILITGFEPFDGQLINPSIEILNLLEDTYNDLKIFKLSVPTVFRESTHLVWENIQLIKPDYVMMLGQAGGRKEISFERIAINIDDANIPDNRGNKPIDEVIYSNGKNAYFQTLPIKMFTEMLRKNNIPATVSNSAGTYVCNHLMYGILHLIDQAKLPIQAGFIHVPFIHEQVVSTHFFSMDIHVLANAIALCIKSLSEEKQ